MAISAMNWLQRRARRQSEAQWAQLVANASDLPDHDRSELRQSAFSARGQINNFLQRTDARAIRSRQRLSRIALPAGTDWRWRPALLSGPLDPAGMVSPKSGQRLADEMALFHDCEHSALILRQLVGGDVDSGAIFPMRLEIMGFAGSYLSLSVDLPTDVVEGLTRNHIIQLNTTLSTEYPQSIYARLNVGHGPNVEQLVHHVGIIEAGPATDHIVEFDLAYTEIREKRLEKIWLDLIIESPRMNAVEVSELLLSRRPRAQS